MGRPTRSTGVARLASVAAFVLVHSPLLGPRSWARVAPLLSAAEVPDLRWLVASTPPSWGALRERAARFPAGAVVVGHAGAGALLPLIGAACGASALVFVDAVVPASNASFAIDGEFRSLLDELAADGTLAPWPEWWGPDTLRELVPHDTDRHELDDAPRVPLAFYDEPVPVPDGWDTMPCGYVRLSDAYDQAATDARRRGWPVVRRAGTHLDPLTQPAEVARAVKLGVSVLQWRPSFRPLTRADLPLVHRWVNTPHVAEWWDDLPTLADVEADFGPGIDGDDPTDYFAIEVDGRPVGLIQTYLIDDEPEYKSALGQPQRAAGVDLAIGEPDLVGRRLGPAVLYAFVTDVVFARGPAGVVDRCVAGPNHRNARSIATFEAAGFRKGAAVPVPGEPEPEQVMTLERV
jgi:RimJ/RimL family protein N-acetyltransferase